MDLHNMPMDKHTSGPGPGESPIVMPQPAPTTIVPGVYSQPDPIKGTTELLAVFDVFTVAGCTRIFLTPEEAIRVGQTFVEAGQEIKAQGHRGIDVVTGGEALRIDRAARKRIDRAK